MTQAVAHILAEIERLSPPDRADLADCIVETLIESTPPEVERAQIDEVRRRIAQVESGAVRLIPGEQAFGPGASPCRISARGELMAGFAFHPDALLEYADATNFYLGAASPAVAERFVAAVESAVMCIVADPVSSKTLRRWIGR